ncbi:Ig-like domain-containing protein [Leptospira sp. 85282-16]|nr:MULTISPECIES: Ig-like domain-containing protein [Leptospira]MCT8335348.1 Ig-like domain-containing protein [Leptospira sp. 85282-16]
MEHFFKRVCVSFTLILSSFLLSSCAAFMDGEGNFKLFQSNKAQEALQFRNQFLLASVFFAGNGSVSKTIGKNGGTIENQAFSLNIPKDALSQDVVITMRVEEMKGTDIPGMTPVASKLVLEPEGTSFAKPVTLTTKYDPKTVQSQIQNELTQIYYYNPSTKDWEQQKTSVDAIAGRLTTELNHFSIYAALHVNIEMIVARVITDSAAIRMAAIQFRNYLDDINQISNRNRFYSLFSRTFLPFLNIVKAEYAPGTDPLRLSFPLDDFDQDGAPNFIDSFPYDPTNNNDTTAPQIVSGTPNTNVLPLQPGNLFTVTFSEPVNELTVIHSGFISRDQNLYAPLKFVSVSLDRKIVTYKNEFTLDSDANYALYVNGVTDEIGNLENGYRLVTSFHTVDIISPMVTSIEPEGQDVNPNITEFKIHFSEPMNAATIKGFALVGLGEPEIIFSSLSADQKTASFTFNPSKPLRSDAAYLLVSSSEARDTSGNLLAVLSKQHFLITQDTEAPYIRLILPEGERVDPTITSFRIDFSESLNASSVQNKFVLRVKQSGSLITINSVDYDDATRRVNLQIPTNSLIEKTEYELEVLPGIQDSFGNAMTTGKIHPFRTTDVTPPLVTSVSPDHERDLFYFSGINIKIKFSDVMDRNSLEFNPLRLENLSDGGVQFVILTSYDPVIGEAIYYLNADQVLSDKEYEYTVPSGIRNIDGIASVATASSRFFTTADKLTPSLPKINNVNLVSCPNQAKLNINFSRLMDFENVNSNPPAYLRLNLRIPELYRYERQTNSICSWNTVERRIENPDFRTCLNLSAVIPYGFLCILIPQQISVYDSVPVYCTVPDVAMTYTNKDIRIQFDKGTLNRKAAVYKYNANIKKGIFDTQWTNAPVQDGKIVTSTSYYCPNYGGPSNIARCEYSPNAVYIMEISDPWRVRGKFFDVDNQEFIFNDNLTVRTNQKLLSPISNECVE